MNPILSVCTIALGMLLHNLVLGQQHQSFHFSNQIVYRMTYQTDSTDPGSVKEEYMELLVGDAVSAFRSVKRGRIDSLIHAKLRADGSYDGILTPDESRLRGEISTPISYTIVKYPKHMLVKDRCNDADFDFRGYSLFKYYEDEYPLAWELDADTVHYDRYVCQRASVSFGGRRWTALFAPDIPIFDGPYKFRGLPGLIVKLSDEQGYWGFELVSIAHIDATIPLLDTEQVIKHRLVSKKAFFSEKKHYVANRTTVDLAAFVIIISDEETKRQAMERDRKRAKADNNWIERIP